MDSLGKLISIEEIYNLNLSNMQKLNGSNGSQLGVSQMLSVLCGYSSYDGYKITTDKHTYLILIDNGQCCCESWGYFASEDDFDSFVGKELIEVNLTDVALNQQKVKETAAYGFYEGGIQFVDFKMSDGSILQFAVYNDHNGYYGHGIIVAKDEEIILSDTL